MSFREKIAWSCLLSTLVVFVPYFWYVAGLQAAGGLHLPVLIPLLLAAIVIEAAINIGATLVIALRSGAERMDERDRAIESRSFRYAYYILSVGLIIAIGFAMFPPQSWDVTLVLASQVTLACFVLAEAVKFATQVVSYRRGA
jgi:hypothetical protein